MSILGFACALRTFAGSSRLLDALTVALGQTSGGKWYVSTLALQLASFEVCVACRGVRTLRVTVNTRMPLSLWGNGDPFDDTLKAQEMRRLPTLRAAAVAWTLPGAMFAPVLLQAALLRDVEWMQTTGVNHVRLRSNAAALSREHNFTQLVTRVVRSPRIYFETMLALNKQEHLASATIRNPRSISWPSALRQLSIGCISTERVDWAALPNSLERLALGGCFDQRIEAVRWPASLTKLTLGGCFDQPIADVVWPSSLLQLTFGVSFNQPITSAVWPASLLQLTFEGSCLLYTSPSPRD